MPIAAVGMWLHMVLLMALLQAAFVMAMSVMGEVELPLLTLVPELLLPVMLLAAFVMELRAV